MIHTISYFTPLSSSSNIHQIKRSSMASTATPIFISTSTLKSTLSYKTLIHHLQISLAILSPTTFHSPLRQSYAVSPSSSLLLMPSWSSSPSIPYIGIKLVTYFPNNSSLNLPGIHGSYVLFNSTTGQTLASMDGTELTLFRTACVSALASKFLSSPNSKTLIMIGAGSLAPHLIKAHLNSRPSLRKVIIWNRTTEKAANLAMEFRNNPEFEHIVFESYSGGLDDIIGGGDIVCSATNSETALVKGSRLKKGAHLNLVGSFKESMKECDDEAIRRGRVYVDCEAALIEAGELVGGFERGVILKEEICGRLDELVRGEREGRREEEITVFKSVGSAVFDILAAQLVYETYMNHVQK